MTNSNLDSTIETMKINRAKLALATKKLAIQQARVRGLTLSSKVRA